MTALEDGLLQDDVVLVSGGTQGVGGAVARAALRNGASVVVTGRRREVGEAFVETLGDRAAYVPCDVADVEQCRAAVAATIERFGRVDRLVNSAAVTTRGALLETTPDFFDHQMAVNVRGPFFLMQGVVAHLVERGAPGAVVNVSSMSAHGGQPHLAAYSTSKAALNGLTRNTAHAHRWDRIRVNAVNLGWTDTEAEDGIQRRFHGAGDDWRDEAGRALPMGRLGQVDEIADLVVFLLSDRSGVVTGSVLDWDQQVPGASD
ncbi:SDR family oxidoreductase [Nocardioides marmoribigeumensis]|uniref:NAD(P)-dependent dehydrogenase (Short-subunit alcohol dehydrogenase family) n=1 Tax=Nocardioides marmoribigeumensis TaxID=433649 RepID=A0ABU2BT91_9ACTN|nr:SDR family oxidoreductase [Nocardioides marmoribigeumensis]MDR7361840.1 NAD(P)-dependent dehydrogenase (short-subunit alcohol dehydrogenase family) [Nocardioides marmoribigeumensis]